VKRGDHLISFFSSAAAFPPYVLGCLGCKEYISY
jgi:hypothetical protein